jgi:hypothetical protein
MWLLDTILGVLFVATIVVGAINLAYGNKGTAAACLAFAVLIGWTLNNTR